MCACGDKAGASVPEQEAAPVVASKLCLQADTFSCPLALALLLT
jgi:hypothetical protein